MFSVKSLLSNATPLALPSALVPMLLSVTMFGCGLVAGLYINAWRLGSEIKELKLEHKEIELAQLRDTRDDMNYAIDAINRSAMAFAATKLEYAEAVDKLTGKLKDHAKTNPLPVNCIPDSGRVSVLNDANARARETYKTATGQ